MAVVREIHVSVLRDAIARLLPEINYKIPSDVLGALRDAAVREESDLGRQTLEQLVRNYEVAAEERTPVCQDSGLTVVMLETGQDVHWTGGSLWFAAIDADPRASERRVGLRACRRRNASDNQQCDGSRVSHGPAPIKPRHP